MSIRFRLAAAASAVRFPGDTSAGDANFAIRQALGLSVNLSVDDCVGHYGGASSTTTSHTGTS